MIQAARTAGTAQRDCTFEVFTRSLPPGRRYGVFTGTGRILDAIEQFRFSEADIDFLRSLGRFTDDTLGYLADYRFTGNISAYEEGELFFPNSPVLRVDATFEQGVLLETLILSILNHDSAISSVGSRMALAAGGRPLIEMGSRRVHEEAAVACARSAAIVGFGATSSIEAGRRYGIPVTGTSAHAFTLLFDEEADAFRAQIASLGPGTSVLVDTYDIPAAIRAAVDIAGDQLGAIRLDSGDLAQAAREARALLDSLGATSTRITATSDLDEYRVFALRDAPIDGFGIGTRLVTGGDYPAQGFVYKLVERRNAAGQLEPVAKRSQDKAMIGGRKHAFRVLNADGAAAAELVLPHRKGETESAANASEEEIARSVTNQLPEGARLRPLLKPLVRGGHAVSSPTPWEQITHGRAVHKASIREVDPSVLTGQDGEQVLPVVLDPTELR